MNKDSKSTFEKIYPFLMLGLGVAIVAYSCYGLWTGQVMTCGRGGACSMLESAEDGERFIETILLYLAAGLFFLYLFARLIKNKNR